MTALSTMRRTNEEPTHDLWPRFQARLADGDRVDLRMPAVTWPVVAMGAAAAVLFAVTPDPLRLLAVAGLL